MTDDGMSGGDGGGSGVPGQPPGVLAASSGSHAHLPLYAQIQRFIRGEIASGRLKEGDQIPTEAALCEQFKAARATVARAVQQLALEGLIVRRAGSGSFVSMRSISEPLQLTEVSSFEDKLALEGASVSYEVLGFVTRAAGEEHGALLKLDATERVFELRRLRVIGDQRASLEIRIIPPAIGGAITVEMLHSRSIHRILDELGSPVRQVVGKIRASTATPDLAAQLDVAPGSALLIRDYTLRDGAGRPLISGESYYRAEFHIDYIVQQIA
ncbi:GntR family transcriptional regulator [Robbsia andropogonis]|uniref:GntR family transcriptional regulator n=1 Tax=Robbsia andropogonis TaxID=28092 RepID=UPI00046479C5|nr:GntR family transcriptional regulator [Robbsia andropogonis]